LCIFVALGNQIMSRYVYDSTSFRLKRMKTERYTYQQSGQFHTYEPQSGTSRQDCAYEYDLVGNILKILDRDDLNVKFMMSNGKCQI
jgi:hypothetical protein